jgi:hypothetical protein
MEKIKILLIRIVGWDWVQLLRMTLVSLLYQSQMTDEN